MAMKIEGEFQKDPKDQGTIPGVFKIEHQKAKSKYCLIFNGKGYRVACDNEEDSTR